MVRVFPPIVCRLLARPKGLMGRSQRPLTDEEIAQASGLTVDTVRLLSTLHSWDDVSVGRFLAFTRGCNIDFDDTTAMDRHWRYLDRRRPTWDYLKRDSQWLTRWQPMLLAHAKYLKPQFTK